jgi:uncharacterized protein (TIGR02646 family)
MDQINPSAAWLQEAVRAENAVRAGSKTVSQLSSVWKDLKPEFSKLSHGKCWYCESRQTRSDNAVDHFRPKSDYPWLAFSYENYRFACGFCNSPHRNPETGRSQGKSNFFPLFENSLQAQNAAEIASEQPILLDPCNATDPGLLDFHSDGTGCSRFPDNPIFTRRVKESIRLYHLDHPDLTEQRRLLARKLKRWIEAADREYPKVLKGDKDAQQAFLGFVTEIGQHLDDHAELSVFARRIVTNYRTKPWIESILDT